SAPALADVMVSSRLGNHVLHYTDAGSFVNQFDPPGSGLLTPNGIALGPDGFVYVASRDGNQILRFTTDGAFDRVFAQGPEMIGPSGIAFCPNGDLFVANSLADNVARYHAGNGLLVGTFGTGGVLHAPVGIAFNSSDQKLYVTGALNNRFVRF